ncbi:acyl carrier protein [Thermomonospora umbrina]|uniref:Act minimal PKS acyl carrier protein n=1 Tax=Thermomonospora umbrina TaxID=111806 RepID=A0A3D9SK01_9ACTN|nr:acyl carrier protein [Thermomonospora umbrina]REE96242.1 act minimal PKS acyl carrier protein [Thermomonospora umbrina]
MAEIGIDDLRRVLVECAGIELDADFSDRTFEELGYDSLALMETAARIKQDYGIDLPDDDVVAAETPVALLELANSVAAA